MKKKIDLQHINHYIELVTDIVFIKNVKGEYTHCNEVYLNFLEISKEELIGKTDYDFMNKENADKCFKDDQDTLNGEGVLHFQDIFEIDNHTVYFKTTKQPLFNLDGNLIGTLSVVRDITETKQYQLIYQDNNELLEYMNHESDTKKILTKIVNLSEKRNKNLKCSILLLNEDKIHLGNAVAPSLPAFYNSAIDGIEIREKIGSCGVAAFKKERVIVENINTHENWKPYLELTQQANLHSCWSEPIFSLNNEVLGTFAMYSNRPSIPNDFQLQLISSYAHLAAVTIEKENKKIEADIQKRKLLQEELNKKTKDLELFKQVVENISYGITITEVENSNKLLYVNKSFETITGYSKKEVIGRNCSFLQNDDIYQKELYEIKKAIEERKKIQVELRNYKKDGTLFYNLISISPVYNKNKQITHFVGIQKDITQDKKRDASLSEQSKLASMGEMIGNIAHQWRQPLSVISTASTGMHIQKELGILEDDDFYKICDSINKNAQYLSQTIDDFKNYIKKDSIQKNFNLSESIKKFLSLVTGTIKNSDIELILDLDDTINIFGFENELIQCYMNIFNNSKDALNNQQHKLLFITSYVKNSCIILRIKDNAGGISDDIIGKIFEPYFTTKHKFQGTGLGLHMTYNLIVDGMRGTIEAKNGKYIYQNETFVGVEFIITLPIS